jgi:hypothetical protein
MNRIVISIDFKTDLIDLFKGNNKEKDEEVGEAREL